MLSKRPVRRRCRLCQWGITSEIEPCCRCGENTESTKLWVWPCFRFGWTVIDWSTDSALEWVFRNATAISSNCTTSRQQSSERCSKFDCETRPTKRSSQGRRSICLASLSSRSIRCNSSRRQTLFRFSRIFANCDQSLVNKGTFRCRDDRTHPCVFDGHKNYE